jgi:hypothetical protein
VSLVHQIYPKKSIINNIMLRVRPARTGRNPKTGDALQIEKKNSIRFSATPTWKAEVQSFVVPPKVKKAPKAAK